MKKSLIWGLALVCCICFADEQKTVVAKPGAILELYSATPKKVQPDVDAEPIAVVVDKGKQFCHDNITLNQEVLHSMRPMFLPIPQESLAE